MKTSLIEPAILDLLQTEGLHLKAHEVYQRLHPRFPSVNRSTVYRVLERLARDGKISVSDIGTGAAVYQKVETGMHHHLVCQKCGQVQTIEHEMVGTFFAQVGGKFDFDITTNHLVLFGLCSVCRTSNLTEEK